MGRGKRLLIMVGLSSGLLAPIARAVPSVPANFAVEDAAPGASFVVPTAMAFLPDGRFFVAEKRGRVYEVRNGIKQPNPTLEIEASVLDVNDRGLLGLAVDPNYFLNHFLYVFYTVDPDTNGNENNNDAFARLARYTVNFTDSAGVIASSRVVLIGHDWTHGVVSASPSHTAGALRWGLDGSLLISVGDGAQFSSVDAGGQDAGAFGAGKTDPSEDIGAFRSQYIGSLAGKILRIDPATGLGYPSNPYATADLSAPQSKVWCYGLRNPYRFCVRPGTGASNPAAGDPGTIYLGDVGWNAYEEMDVASVGGKNFGWPCFEAIFTNNPYQAATPAHNGCGSFGTPTNPAQPSFPISHWSHGIPSQSNPQGITGNTSTGGVFYTRTTYPIAYRDRYFYADYGQNWIRVAVTDNNDALNQVLDFGTELDGPVDLATHPLTGDVHYVAINAQQVRRIRYTGPIDGDNPPVATVGANPTGGPAPLTVNFSSVGSFDPDGDPLGYSWLFADGSSSTAANPTHVYGSPGTYVAQLTLSDGRGGLDIETVTITVLGGIGSFPSTNVLDNFNRANGAIGSPWVDATSGLNVVSNTLRQSVTTNSTVWNGGTFGANQEAYLTFVASSPTASEENLMLKVQGTTWSSGHIEVAYNPGQNRVNVNTYAPSQGWVGRGGIQGVSFAAGERFGVRVDSTGLVSIFRNATLLGNVPVVGWPFATAGGRIGLTLTQSSGSIFDDFGGGNVVFQINTPPTAQILSPTQDAFFYENQDIALSGVGNDDQTASGSLTYQWVVDLHHNNHIHPASHTFSGPTATLVGENHDDGTGVFYRIFLIVTDPGGLSDTASVDIWPETDLEPDNVTVIPDPALPGQPVEYRFTLRNNGRMPTPISRWSLTRDNFELAARDTLVPALDSVRVSVFGVAPATGTYALRARADTLGTVFETNEANNAVLGALVVEVPNTAPEAAIAEPVPGYFYFAADTVQLVASASDGQQSPESLDYQWTVRLHRSTGDSLVVTVLGDSADLVTDDFEDGHGVRYEVTLLVTDGGGLQDSAAVTIRPDQDLAPRGIVTNADHVAAGSEAAAAFWLRNLGGLSAQVTHWRLLLDGALLAEGDTAVAPVDSVRIHAALPGDLTVGPHSLRAVADTLDQAIEPNESNNAAMLEFTVPATTTGVADPPRTLALSAPRPNPTRGATSLALELPEATEVGFDVLDVQGRVVWAGERRLAPPGRWSLDWTGVRSDGSRAAPGLYLGRVRAGDRVWLRRIALVR